MTKKHGVLICLAILVFISSGCSDNTNISKQDERVITNKINTSAEETHNISTTNTINEETAIPSATNTLTEEAILPSPTNTTTEETIISNINNNSTDENLISSTNNTSVDSRAMEQNDSTSTDKYSNPIDAYFIPRIENSSSGKRSYQDTYRGVWKAEFENILKVLDQKCVYQKDKDDLIAYKNSVEQLIKSTQDIVVTYWHDDYNVPPPDTDTYRTLWGNGTRSALGQIEGEIYRDASMLLLEKMYDLNYKFLEKDYSKEHYE